MALVNQQQSVLASLFPHTVSHLHSDGFDAVLSLRVVADDRCCRYGTHRMQIENATRSFVCVNYIAETRILVYFGNVFYFHVTVIYFIVAEQCQSVKAFAVRHTY